LGKREGLAAQASPSNVPCQPTEKGKAATAGDKKPGHGGPKKAPPVMARLFPFSTLSSGYQTELEKQPNLFGYSGV
jgi:hypothetical protein